MSTDQAAMQRLGEIHLAEARKSSLRLCSYVTGVFPEEWQNPIVEDCTVQLLHFSYHARRLNQICALDSFVFRPVDKRVVSFSEGDPGGWQPSYQHALNGLHHATSFVFGWAHADHRQLYGKTAANLIPVYVKVETDQFPVMSVSIFGVADCFLSEVISVVREKFPRWRTLS